MNILSKIVIPIFVLFVIFYGFFKKVNIYDTLKNAMGSCPTSAIEVIEVEETEEEAA